MNETPYFLLYGRDPMLPQDSSIPSLRHFHRQITTSDLDIYKTRLLGILKGAHSALDKHKKQYQDSYKQILPLHFSLNF